MYVIYIYIYLQSFWAYPFFHLPSKMDLQTAIQNRSLAGSLRRDQLMVADADDWGRWLTIGTEMADGMTAADG